MKTVFEFYPTETLTPNTATRFHILPILFFSDLSLYIWFEAGKNLPEL